MKLIVLSRVPLRVEILVAHFQLLSVQYKSLILFKKSFVLDSETCEHENGPERS